MSSTSTRLPARLPVPTSVFTCPRCKRHEIRYAHVPGVSVLLDAAIAEHLRECHVPARPTLLDRLRRFLP